MGKFKEWFEDTDYMAKGINIQSDVPLARHIVGLNIVDGLGPKKIAADPEVASKGGLPHPNSISRILKKYGLTPDVRELMSQAKQGAQEKANADYDKYHNRNLHGTNPERDYVSDRMSQAQMGEPLPPNHKDMVAPPGYHKVKGPDGLVYLRPLEQDVDQTGGEAVLSSRWKDYPQGQNTPDVVPKRGPRKKKPGKVIPMNPPATSNPFTMDRKIG